MATTEPRGAGRDLRPAAVRAALCALLLGLPLAALAQEPPSEQQLLDRLQQLQGEMTGAQVTRPVPPEVSDQQLLAPQQIEDQIGQQLGVQVLAVTPVEAAGGARYAVKVMNPPGNYNGAFLVSTLLVDAVSGAIVGEASPEGGLARPIEVPDSDESGPEARRLTYR